MKINIYKQLFKQVVTNQAKTKPKAQSIFFKQFNTKCLSFNMQRSFSQANNGISTPLNQGMNLLDHESELYIEDSGTRQINDLVQKEKYREAIDKSKQVLSTNEGKDNNRIRYLLAYSLKKQGNKKEAIDQFKSFIENVQSKKQAKERDNLEIFVESSYLELAFLCRSIGQMSECLNYVEKSITLNPLFANQDLIESYIIGKQIERGIQFLQNQHEIVPKNEMIIYLKGFLQESLNDVENALITYQKAIDISYDQKHKFANFRVGMILKRNGDYESSTCHLIQAVEKDPENYAAKFNLGQNYRFLGEGVLGKEQLESCMKQQPENTLPLYDLALCYEQTGEMEKSIEYLQKNIEANDTHIESYLRLTNIFAAQNNKQQALKYIKLGIFSDDFFREDTNCLNLIDILMGKVEDQFQLNSVKTDENNKQNSCSPTAQNIEQLYKDMEQQFLNLNLHQDKGRSQIFSFFTQLFLLTNQNDLAIESEKKLVEFKINILQHRLNLATLYRNKKDLSQSIQQYKELIKLQPDEGNYYYFCGQIQLEAGQLSEAINSYKEAIKIQGENDYCLYELSESYKQNNQMEESNKYKEQLIKYFPDFYAEETNHIKYIESLMK